VPKPDVAKPDLQLAIQNIVSAELRGLPAFVDRLVRGELPVC
jgi:hypothetical protein